MKVTTEIDDDDLDSRFPDPDDEPVPHRLMVNVVVRNADGIGHAGTVIHHGQPTPDVVAEALISALHGAARTHSPATAAAVAGWLVVPPDLEVVPGGED